MGQAGHKNNLEDLRSCVEKTTQLLLKTLIFKPILKVWVFFFRIYLSIYLNESRHKLDETIVLI
jgi:hypothetical protein